jgi:hypothetical protein
MVIFVAAAMWGARRNIVALASAALPVATKRRLVNLLFMSHSSPLAQRDGMLESGTGNGER